MGTVGQTPSELSLPSGLSMPKRVRRMLTGASMGRPDSWRICQNLVSGNHCLSNYRCTRQPLRPLFSSLELMTSCQVQRRGGMWEVRDLLWMKLVRILAVHVDLITY